MHSRLMGLAYLSCMELLRVGVGYWQEWRMEEARGGVRRVA